MSTDALYETDFVVWTERQAEALRAAARERSNLPIDWERVAEEIEDLGSEIRHKIEGLTHQILVHLLKLACSPAQQPRAGWETDIDGFRRQLNRRLRDNHALRARFGHIVRDEWSDAVEAARSAFVRFDELDALPCLELWRTRGMSADEVQTIGTFPARGTTDVTSFLR